MKIKKGQQKLTKAQEAYCKRFAKRQIEKYLSTNQTLSDKKIEAYVRNAYKVAGLNPPEKIRWFKSPEAFMKRWNLVWDSVWYSIRDSVWDSVRESVWDSVRDSVWYSVWYSVGDSVGDSVWYSVGDSVRDSVRDSVGYSVRAWHYADALSFYRFFHETLEPNDLIWLSEVSENVTGYNFYEKECWLVRKPVVLTRDEEGRLHNETGMAIKWSDGTGYYVYHGVKVNKKIIETPEKLTKEDWEKEANLEVRRVIQERMGDRFVKALKAKSISKDNFGELLEISLENDPEKVAKYVKVKDASTRRLYFLRVPPDIETAKAGVAWSFGMEESEYNPKQET